MITLNKSQVRFDQDEHRYYLGVQELKGITGTLIRMAFPDTYKDIPDYILKNAADRGSIIHEQLELFNTIFNADQSAWQGEWTNELSNYSRIKQEQKLEHIAAEYLVTDGKNFASSIDAVFTDGNGDIVLADYKTTSQLHYDNVSLQLSIYAKFFEAMNPELKVKHIACIWLHGTESKYAELPRVSDEKIDELIKAYLENDSAYVYKTDTPDEFVSLEQDYVDITCQINTLQEIQDDIKAKMLKVMKDGNVKSLKTACGTYSYTPGGKQNRFDTTRFKKEHKDIYDSYLTESSIKEKLTIKLK